MAFKSNMLFDVLANILVSKSRELYKRHVESVYFKDAAKFMILKYLSMHTNPAVRNIVIEHYFTLEKMPENILYLWLLRTIPKQSSSFIKYIK